MPKFKNWERYHKKIKLFPHLKKMMTLEGKKQQQNITEQKTKAEKIKYESFKQGN